MILWRRSETRLNTTLRTSKKHPDKLLANWGYEHPLTKILLGVLGSGDKRGDKKA